MKKIGVIVVTGLVSALAAVGAYRLLDKSENNVNGPLDNQSNVHFTNNPAYSGGALPDFNFVGAAAAATPGVVHIRTVYAASGGRQSPWDQFFGTPRSNMPSRGSGSGVIITNDGYIATNNHVVENASEIEVVLPDKRTFKAKLAGRDPNTDLALVKITAKDLPVVKIGNSDNVQIGEWVLAIGYPFSLNTTVTAGIISAKGRSIGILDETQRQGGIQTSSAIESFIQTDAAINPGNSGGALVNTNGELIGINAAIASQTGSYSGYGFAIPANLAKKILEDLIKFGTVKRAYLGVTFPAPIAEEQFLRDRGINPGSVEGVFITGVQSNSAAASGGLKAGDIIKSIDGVKVNSSAEFSERIGRHRPGDKVEISYLRGNKIYTATVTLKGGGDASLADNSDNAVEEAFSKLGAKFQPATAAIKQRLRITSGVLVTDVLTGGFFDYIGLPEGTIITSMGGRPVNNESDIKTAIGRANDGVVRVDAIIPDGSRLVFNLSFGA